MTQESWAESVNLRRLLTWFIIAEAISLTYFVVGLFASGPLGEAIRWFFHNATFSIFHHSGFAVAVGLFAATARNLFKFEAVSTLANRAYRSFVAGLLVILIAAALGIALLDAATHGGLLPPYLPDDSRANAYALEGKTRGNKGVELLPAELETYKNLIGWTTEPQLVRLWDGNSLALISVAIDCLFGSFVAIFFWYVAVASVRTYLGIENHRGGTLGAIFACLCLWFPLRIYATWYERYLFEERWLAGYSALNFMLLLFFVVGSLIALLLVRNTTAVWISGGVSLLAGGLGVFSKLKPDLVGDVAKSVEGLHWYHLMVLWFVILIALVVLVMRVVYDMQRDDVANASAE